MLDFYEKEGVNRMELKEAMRLRHTVRKYTEQPLLAETVEQLNKCVNKINEAYKVSMVLKTEDAHALPGPIKLFLAKGVRNYFIMAGPDAPDTDETLGYCGAELMLYAQTLGLNTWWIGGAFNKKAVGEMVPGGRVAGVVAVGYGRTQGTPHKSKQAGQVSDYDGNAPEWFKRGIDAALLAPTALGKQAFRITGFGNSVSLTCNNGIFSGVDAGLVKYHFELGAGKENFVWR